MKNMMMVTVIVMAMATGHVARPTKPALINTIHTVEIAR